MNRAFSLLLVFIMLQTQVWAVSGEPRYPNLNVSYVGTYSGVIIPVEGDTATFSTGTDLVGSQTSAATGGTGVPGSSSPGSSVSGDSTAGAGTDGLTSLTEDEKAQMGIFGLVQPAVGLAEGSLILFVGGALFNGVMEGIINPKNGGFRAVISCSSFLVSSDETFTAGFGTMRGKVYNQVNSIPGTMTSPDIEGAAFLRLITPSNTTNGVFTDQTNRGLKFKVVGFHQSTSTTLSVSAGGSPLTSFSSSTRVNPGATPATPAPRP